MDILVNGEKKVLPETSLSLEKLLETLKIENPAMVTIQRNGQFVDKSLLSTTMIVNGDEIDFVYFLGGGR